MVKEQQAILLPFPLKETSRNRVGGTQWFWGTKHKQSRMYIRIPSLKKELAINSTSTHRMKTRSRHNKNMMMTSLIISKQTLIAMEVINKTSLLVAMEMDSSNNKQPIKTTNKHPTTSIMDRKGV